MGCIQVDVEASGRTGSPHQVRQTNAKDVKRMDATMGAQEEKNQGAGEDQGQYKRRCWTGEKETRPGRAYCCVRCWDPWSRGGRCKVRASSGRCPSGYIPERERPGQGRIGGPVLEMHQGGGAGTEGGPENDGMGVLHRDHAHYGRQGTVVGAGTAAAQEGVGG